MFIRSLFATAVLGSLLVGTAVNAQTATAHGMIGEPVSFIVESPTQPGGPTLVTWLIGDDITE